MFTEVDPRMFVHVATPNRSLGLDARRWLLVAIAVNTLGIASFVAALGAWPVLPFAGLEVALVALAFHVLALHDGDYERLEVAEHEVRYEARFGREVTRFAANPAWARVRMASRGECCALWLVYRGHSVALGKLLTDEGRRQLAAGLRGRLPVEPIRDSQNI
jgi:uncharacterized membrane protein